MILAEDRDKFGRINKPTTPTFKGKGKGGCTEWESSDDDVAKGKGKGWQEYAQEYADVGL